MDRKINQIIRLILYIAGAVGLIILSYKAIREGLGRYRNYQNLHRVDYEDLIVNEKAPVAEEQPSADPSGSDVVTESADEAPDQPSATDEPIFPIIIESPKINIEIYDYYFVEEVPDDFGDIDLISVLKEAGSESLFDEEGNFNHKCIFMVMDCKVTNNLDEAWEYGFNSVSIDFGKKGEDPYPFYIQEMFYFTARQRSGTHSMFYNFEPYEEYRAKCCFWIKDLEHFFDENQECYLVNKPSYSNRLQEGDSLLILDRNRWKK